MAKSPRAASSRTAPPRAAVPGAAVPGAAAPAASGRPLFWLQGMLCGILVAVATPTALVIGVLLAPGLIALSLDRAPGKPVARAVLLFGLGATVAPLATLWRAGQTMDVAGALIGEMSVLATAWSAAAGGWLCTQLLPPLIRLGLESAALARTARLRILRARCAEEWSFPPAPANDEG